MSDFYSEHVTWIARNRALVRLDRQEPMWHSMSCICKDCLASDVAACRSLVKVTPSHLAPRVAEVAREAA